MGWIQHNFDMRDGVHVCTLPDLNRAAIGSVWECDDCHREWKIAECEAVTWSQGDRFGTQVYFKEKYWLELQQKADSRR